MAAQRYETKEKASLEIYGKGGQLLAELRNLSITGACLEWTQEDFELSKGDLVRMTVVLKAMNRKHNINAEVVWVEGKRSGLNFIKYDEVLDRMFDKNGF
jgi:hypothetical protein